MSRSIRQDFTEFLNRKREEFNVPEEKVVVPILKKQGAIMFISDAVIFEQLSYSDSRYERKATKTIVASTTEDWAKYHLAKRALLTLKDYENTTGAEEVEIPCPKPKTEYHFLETVDEWLDRCRALQAERTAA